MDVDKNMATQTTTKGDKNRDTANQQTETMSV